jgi:putative FmdB family regulatory protein
MECQPLAPAPGGVVPTYQYACTECGHDFEAVQAFSDDSLTDCPACQGRLRKVFGNVGVVFKGSGFYRNDSRDAKPKNGEATVKAEGKTDAAKTDAKPTTNDSKAPAAAKASSSSKDSGSPGSSGSSASSTSSTTGSAA